MFEKLEKWLNDYEKEMLDDLLGLKEAVAYARPIIYNQCRGSKKWVYEVPELKERFRGYSSWELPNKYELRVEKDLYYDKGYTVIEGESSYVDAIIEIDGVEYKHTVMYHTAHYSIKEKKFDALTQYVFDKGHSPKDIDLIDGRDEEWIIKYCDKEKEIKRKYIEEKVRKICEDSVEEVAGKEVSDLYVRGSNGRVAHIWAIYAGGYNIQRLHIRILVKEVK